MKKLKHVCMFVCIATFTVATLSSCSKEETTKNNPVESISSADDALKSIVIVEGIENYINGELVTSCNEKAYIKQLATKSNMEMVTVHFTESIHHFTQEDAFAVWGEKDIQNKEIYEANAKLEAIANYVQKNGLTGVEDFESLPAEAKTEVIAILGENPSKRVNTKAGAATAYDGINYQGSSYTFSINFHPSFGNFRNKAESLKAYGLGGFAICDSRWFSGAKKWFPAALKWEVNHLETFRNRAESAMGI